MAGRLVQVADAFVAGAHKPSVDKTFANVQRSCVSLTISDPLVRASAANATASTCVAPSQAVATAAVDVGAVLEIVVESSKTRSNGINKTSFSVRVAISRAAGSGGLEVFGNDGVLDLRSGFCGTHVKNALDAMSTQRRTFSPFYQIYPALSPTSFHHTPRKLAHRGPQATWRFWRSHDQRPTCRPSH